MFTYGTNQHTVTDASKTEINTIKTLSGPMPLNEMTVIMSVAFDSLFYHFQRY